MTIPKNIFPDLRALHAAMIFIFKMKSPYHENESTRVCNNCESEQLKVVLTKETAHHFQYKFPIAEKSVTNFHVKQLTISRKNTKKKFVNVDTGQRVPYAPGHHGFYK